jgi:general stress protein 26
MPSIIRKSFLSFPIVIVLGFAMTATAQSELSRRDSEALSHASLIYIATVRKDGNQSTAAPVWFTTMPGGLILIQTAHTSWKARRIRRGSPVIVWIGSRSGPAFIANAAITNEPAVISRIVTDYPKKYFLAWIGLHTPTDERFASGQIVAIKVIPVRDLPDGFKSTPGSPAPNLNEKASNQDSLPD